jgi:hypothetical protein
LAIAQAAQSEPEDRADVALVEELERLPVALRDAHEQGRVGLADRRRGRTGLWHGTQLRRDLERKFHVCGVSTCHGAFRILKS